MSNALDDLRQTLMRIITRDVLSTHNNDGWGVHNASDNIIAALPGLVKPLEWEHEEGCNMADAVGTGGRLYRVLFSRDGRSRLRINASRYEQTDHPTPQAAKDAAQAMEVAAIMAAFGIDAAMREGKHD